jgi:hypothetical protein
MRLTGKIRATLSLERGRDSRDDADDYSNLEILTDRGPGPEPLSLGALQPGNSDQFSFEYADIRAENQSVTVNRVKDAEIGYFCSCEVRQPPSMARRARIDQEWIEE